ncbi:MAG: tetratricopeptide repeat protein [Acidimicrobiales bacterium]
MAGEDEVLAPPGDERARFERAADAYHLADYESAVDQFGLLYQETGRPEYLWNQAAAMLRMSRWADAKAIFGQFVGEMGRSQDDHVRALEGYFMADRMWGDYDLGFHRP